MPRLILWTCFAAFIAVMLIYRQILIIVTGHLGATTMIALLIAFYAAFCFFHKRASNY